jgi:hypothetical protein
MLFNSYQFIFLFLPITWAGYFLLGRFSTWSPVVWLALASLVFYSVSNWQFVALLLASIAFNYVIGSLLIRAKLSSAAFCGADRRRGRRPACARLFQICRLPCRRSECIGLDPTDREHSASGRDFLLQHHPDRVFGGRLSRRGRALSAALLRPVRHLFSASDRRTDPSPQGRDSAIRTGTVETPRSALGAVRTDDIFDRIVQENLHGGRHPAICRARLRTNAAFVRPGMDRRPRLHVPALF